MLEIHVSKQGAWNEGPSSEFQTLLSLINLRMLGKVYAVATHVQHALLTQGGASLHPFCEQQLGQPT